MIASTEGADAPTSPEEAMHFAQKLFGYYPQKDNVADPETYAGALTATLAKFPVAAVRRVCAIDGLAFSLSFRPAPADVAKACEAEVRRVTRLRLGAQWMLDEHKRRARARQEAEENAVAPEERERMKQRVADLLAGLHRGLRDAGLVKGTSSPSGTAWAASLAEDGP